MKNLTLENLAAACNGRYVGPEEKRTVCVTAVSYTHLGIRDTSFGGYRVLALAVTVSIVAAAVISILLARHIRKKNDRDKKDEKDN